MPNLFTKQGTTVHYRDRGTARMKHVSFYGETHGVDAEFYIEQNRIKWDHFRIEVH